jgi:hypothetical protein
MPGYCHVVPSALDGLGVDTVYENGLAPCSMNRLVIPGGFFLGFILKTLSGCNSGAEGSEGNREHEAAGWQPAFEALNLCNTAHKKELICGST